MIVPGALNPLRKKRKIAHKQIRPAPDRSKRLLDGNQNLLSAQAK
jgi:hypothetical protein